MYTLSGQKLRSRQRPHSVLPLVSRQPDDGSNAKTEPKRPRSMAGVREEGLAKPVGGIGLALLQKMGFKEGSGLGAGGAGIAQPLQVEIRGRRTGLGVHEVRACGGLPVGHTGHADRWSARAAVETEV